ncbi:unnamed protein product [Lampetra fluviatilis]
MRPGKLSTDSGAETSLSGAPSSSRVKNSDFTLRGASKLTCDSTTKKWSSTAPRCEQTSNAKQSSNHSVGETPRQGSPTRGPTQRTSSPTHEEDDVEVEEVEEVEQVQVEEDEVEVEQEEQEVEEDEVEQVEQQEEVDDEVDDEEQELEDEVEHTQPPSPPDDTRGRVHIPGQGVVSSAHQPFAGVGKLSDHFVGKATGDCDSAQLPSRLVALPRGRFARHSRPHWPKPLNGQQQRALIKVIFRAVTPSRPLDDPFGAAARQRLGVTNLRLRLLRRQECRRCPAPPPSGVASSAASSAVSGGEDADSSPGHFAVYDLILRGSCLCHGHAERCEPAPGASSSSSSSSSLVSVHGRCVCHHHTEGQHCERCRPIYNDRPWQPGNGKTGEPNECQKCHCNGPCGQLPPGPRAVGGIGEPQRRPAPPRARAEPASATRWARSRTSGRRAATPARGTASASPAWGGRHCDRCMMGYWGFGEGGCIPCHCAGSCDPHTGTCTEGFDAEPRHEVPVGGRIPDLIPSSPNRHAAKAGWEDEQQGFSAARDPGKCLCKDRSIASVEEFCAMKYTYVLKARVLSAHDRGSHAEVNVKVDKVLRGARRRGDSSGGTLYPESWTHRGCTCPVLNPGMDYLIAGQEDLKTKRLVVDLNSYVKPWKSSVAKEVMAFLRAGCPKA